jgi:hypothetical protein
LRFGALATDRSWVGYPLFLCKRNQQLCLTNPWNDPMSQWFGKCKCVCGLVIIKGYWEIAESGLALGVSQARVVAKPFISFFRIGQSLYHHSGIYIYTYIHAERACPQVGLLPRIELQSSILLLNVPEYLGVAQTTM